MSMEKTIVIDGRPVRFRASAAVPRMYRVQFRRDLFRDLRKVQSYVDKQDVTPVDDVTVSENDDTFSLELFENIAYIMAKHADPDVPDDPDKWLEQFGTFSIYEILPQLIGLWGLNIRTEVTAKKK